MQAMSDELLRHRALGGISRSRLLTVLSEARRWMTVQELAGKAALRANTTREHLDRLVSAGVVERTTTEPKGRGRPAYLYRAKPQVDEGAAYMALANAMADAIAQREDAAASAIAAGKSWGKMLGRGAAVTSTKPVSGLVELLDGLGFEPTLARASSVIELRSCPFRALARTHGNVVCNLHLGLMRGALDELDPGSESTSSEMLSLEPFVAPSLCLAHLEAATDVG
jgi:predicted ArsR family transcriptional regulator